MRCHWYADGSECTLSLSLCVSLSTKHLGDAICAWGQQPDKVKQAEDESRQIDGDVSRSHSGPVWCYDLVGSQSPALDSLELWNASGCKRGCGGQKWAFTSCINWMGSVTFWTVALAVSVLQDPIQKMCF